MNDTTIYYIIKKDKIVDIILNNKDKAEELLNKLQKDPSESDWLPSRIEECKVMECSNELVEGINKVYTITLNEEIVYTIINNEFTARKVYKHLVNMSQTDEYPREYKIRCDKIEYEINKNEYEWDEIRNIFSRYTKYKTNEEIDKLINESLKETRSENK